MQFVQIKRNGKIWMLSQKDFRKSLCLYHSNNWKGRLFKCILLLFYKFHCVTILPIVKIVDFELEDAISSFIRNIYNCQSFDFSIYSNIEGITQKQTIQIANQSRILGYCQISDSKELFSKFNYERDFLNYLIDKTFCNVPIPLYIGMTNNKVVFCQSTKMSKESKSCYSWNRKHTKFLKDLYFRTMQKKKFEQTDFYNLLLKHKSISYKITEKKNSYVLEVGIKRIINTYKSKMVKFGACHWDFTPWNMFTEKGELFVFDWEYAQYTFPPYIDYFHYFTQNCILSKGITDSNKIYSLYLKEKSKVCSFIQNPDIIYICYLVAIIVFYFVEHKGFSEKDKSCKCWFGLLNILNHQS